MYIIKVSSVTNAQRAAKLLRLNSIKSEVTRIKNPSPREGCGYALKVNVNDIDALSEFLIENGVRVVGVDTV